MIDYLIMVFQNVAAKVEAVYSYRAANNDELTFVRGDVITVTQRDPDDGWWEGILNSSIGWFPSNYVTPHESSDVVPETAVDVLSQQQTSRSLILRDIVQSERKFIEELTLINDRFLIPLRKSQRLPTVECTMLTGNLEEVICQHSKLLDILVMQEKLQSDLLEHPEGDQPRIGQTFLEHAPEVRRVQLTYCRSHPQAVTLLDKHKESLNTFLESLGSPFSGVMALTTGLSLVFRRLDKYPAMLLEYGRFLEEVHPDRGNVQRSFHVYKDISACCSERRRRRELEIEIMSGKVLHWQGDPVSSLGDIIHFDVVRSVNGKQRDRHLALFPNVLVHLNVSSRLSAFVYEGRISLSSVFCINRITSSRDHTNAFEIKGEITGRTVIECASAEDLETWLEQILTRMKVLRSSFTIGDVKNIAPPLPLHHVRQEKDVARISWSVNKLRPTLPLRPSMALGREDSARKSSRHIIYKHRKNLFDSNMDNSFENDNILLRVIELYCSSNTTMLRKSAKNDSTIPSTVKDDGVDSQPTIADGGRSQTLSKQVDQLVIEVGQLRRLLEGEIRQRQQLEALVNAYINGTSTHAFH